MLDLMKQKHLLYFGPITILIEWTALIIASFYFHAFHPNQALSEITAAAWPLPFIFGLTLTVASITYFLFALALRSYSKLIPYFALIAGIAFALAGWIPYHGHGGTTDLFHNLCSYTAGFGYTAIVWLLRKHPSRKVSLMSTIIFSLAVTSIALAFITLFVVHKYVAYIQLLIMVLLQTWALIVTFYERTKLKLADGTEVRL